MKEPLARLEKVCFSYDGRAPILTDVSCSIFPGEKIGIFGPNGGGKTTFLKLLLGLILPKSGKLVLPEKNSVSYVPQILHFDKSFPISVLEVVLMGLLNHLPWWGHFSKKTKEKAYLALEQVGLSLFAHSPFGSLSLGQAQRVLIARALISSPKLLLLDEPTASVDPKASEEILKLVFECSPNLTILFVTHDLEVMLGKFDRLLCINQTVSSLLPKEICEHFALGLYHTPLLQAAHVRFPS